jgi:putative endonuclease
LLRGYRILERNVKFGRYELDIIAKRGDTVAFVEVKARQTGALVPPEENVNWTKRKHIRTAARSYMAMHRDKQCYYRYDIASVEVPVWGKSRVTYYENAFTDDND